MATAPLDVVARVVGVQAQAANAAYLGLCSALYLFAPRVLLAPYAAGADPASFAEVGRLSAVLLRFVTVYSLFDMMSVIFAAALKGAGDTTYPLVATLALSWGVMVIPSYVLCVHFGAGLYTAWTTASAYIFLVGLLMCRRFRGGRWKSLRVIEAAQAAFDQGAAEPA